jgi:hypothetical protein
MDDPSAAVVEEYFCADLTILLGQVPRRSNDRLIPLPDNQALRQV